MIDLEQYAIFPRVLLNNNGITSNLEDLEKINKIMEEVQRDLNLKSGSRNDITYGANKENSMDNFEG